MTTIKLLPCGPLYKIDVSYDLDDSILKRRLNTGKILPKSKRNHYIIQPWQSRHRRNKRNLEDSHHIVTKKMIKNLTDEIDRQIIDEILEKFNK